MSSQLVELQNGINSSREQVTTLFTDGQKRLETMRTLVSSPGAIEPRADRFSSEVVALTGVIASLGQTSIAPSIRRAADDLSLGFIAPIPDGAQADLVSRQDRVMETIRTSVAAQSKVLSQAADEILARAPVAERRFVPLSSAEAVLRYASDFIPAWAGAISIDLLPGVLVFILAVVHGAIRKQEETMPFAERITVAELMEALAIQRAITAQAGDTATVDEMVARMDGDDEANGPNNITSLDLKSPRKIPPA
jgi:hypothetical protein